MKLNIKLVTTLLFTSMATAVMAQPQPLPNVIVQDEKAVIPVTKTQIIRTIAGQAPVRSTEMTVLEMKNKGQDIVAKDVKYVDANATFDQERLKVPRLQEKSAIVPTSKIEEKAVITQGGMVISEINQIDAVGVEFKKGHEPVRKELKVGTVDLPEGKISRAVISHNGKTSKDVTIVRPAE